MHKIKNTYRGETSEALNGTLKSSYEGVTVSGKPITVLVAKPGNVTSLHLNTALSEVEQRHSKTDIDYCDSAITLISAVEEKTYQIVFVDYNLPHIDLCSLLKFVREESPSTKVIVTSAPVWAKQDEKIKVTSLCSSCCHESFYDLDVETFIKSSSKLKSIA